MPQEAERLATLRRTALLDTDPDELFDRHVRIAAAIAETPIAIVSLVDHDRQWFKAKKGIDKRETPRAWAFCDKVVLAGRRLVIEDARKHPDFMDDPLVTGAPDVRFYAGTPLTVGNGQTIGTLCVIDDKPRRLPAGKLAALEDLAAVLSREIDTHYLSHAQAAQADATRRAQTEIRHQMRNTFAKVNAIMAMTGREGLPPEDLAQTTQRRVTALSKMSELGLRTRSGVIRADALLEAALGPWAGEPQGGGPAGPRLTAESFGLTGAAASVLGPMLEELAFLSQRRGGLGGQTTELAVRFYRLPDEERVQLEWIERAAAALPPGDAAFPSLYVTEWGPAALRASCRIEISAERILYALDMPEANVVARSAS